MKKSLFLIVAAVMMLAANSCKKENVNEPNEPEVNREPQANEFCADIANGAKIMNLPSVEDGMSTKTHFSGTLTVKWDSDDVIKVYDNTAASWRTFTCTVSSTETSTRAYFEDGSACDNGDAGYYAFFGPVTPTTTITGTLASTQAWTKNHHSNNLPMFAQSANHWLTFHNVCGAIRFTVPSVVASADQIIVEADTYINGSFTIEDATTNSPYMVLGTGTDDNKRVTLTGTFAAGDTICIPLPANTTTGYKFNVKFLNGAQMPYETGMSKSALVVENNKIYNISLPTPQIGGKLLPGLFNVGPTGGSPSYVRFTSGNLYAVCDNPTASQPKDRTYTYHIEDSQNRWLETDDLVHREHVTLFRFHGNTNMATNWDRENPTELGQNLFCKEAWKMTVDGIPDLFCLNKNEWTKLLSNHTEKEFRVFGSDAANYYLIIAPVGMTLPSEAYTTVDKYTNAGYLCLPNQGNAIRGGTINWNARYYTATLGGAGTTGNPYLLSFETKNPTPTISIATENQNRGRAIRLVQRVTNP